MALIASVLLSPLSFGWAIFVCIAPYLLAAIFLGYLLPHAAVSLIFNSRNLKHAYNAEWALVTGASSGK